MHNEITHSQSNHTIQYHAQCAENALHAHDPVLFLCRGPRQDAKGAGLGGEGDVGG